jgi:hypothetical protein
MSCKCHRHAKEQERIRHLERELQVAREEIRTLKDGNVSSNIREQSNLESRCKPKNSKSRCCRFSAGDAGVKLSNRFSALKTDTVDVDQQNQVLLKHECERAKSVTEKIYSKRKILFWGSSHGREMGPMLQETLGKCLIMFKPNAPLANVVEGLGKLGK